MSGKPCTVAAARPRPPSRSARSLSGHVAHVRGRGVGRHDADREHHGVRVDIQAVCLRIERAAGPVRAAGVRWELERRDRTIRIAEHGWRIQRADVVALDELERFGAQRRREVDQVVNPDSLPVERNRLGGEGLGRAGLLARHGRLRHGPFFNRPDRCAGFAIQDEEERLLGWLGQRLDAAAVQRHVEQDGRAREVVVPQAVMDGLVVPLPLAGLDIERDEALVEQRVARPVAAVIIARRHFDGQVDQAELEVRAHLRPHAHVAVLQGRFILPGVVAKLAGLRNRVENPQPLARLHVEAAHVALRVAHRLRDMAGSMGGADDHHVARDERRGIQAELRGDGIEILIVVELQIHDAGAAEGRDRHARPGVQGDHPVAGRHVDDALIRSVGARPVRRRPGPRRCAGRSGRAAPSSSACIQSSSPVAASSATTARRVPTVRIEHAADHERCGRIEVVRPRPERIRVEPPGDLQLRKIVLVDLVERRVAQAGEVAAIRLPFDHRRRVCRPGLERSFRRSRARSPTPQDRPQFSQQFSWSGRRDPW